MEDGWVSERWDAKWHQRASNVWAAGFPKCIYARSKLIKLSL